MLNTGTIVPSHVVPKDISLIVLNVAIFLSGAILLNLHDHEDLSIIRSRRLSNDLFVWAASLDSVGWNDYLL